MRKVVWLMHVSLDGFVAGPNGDIDWVRFDDDLVEDVQALVDSADTALFGRVTYQLMESYWPTVADSPAASKHDLRSEEHTSELQSHSDLVCRLLLEKKN